MKTILVINDYSAEAANAAKMALNIGRKVAADIIIANTVKVNEKTQVKGGLQMAGSSTIVPDEPEVNLVTQLESINGSEDDYKPVITVIDASLFSETNLAELIIKNDIWLMVKGIRNNPGANQSGYSLNAQAVLNRVRCPLMLVPESFVAKDFERIVYINDLRYCRLLIIKYLVSLAKTTNARLQVAHLSANGMPDMEQHYSEHFFAETVSLNCNYDQMFFSNIKERDINKAVDVMINGLHADLLVLVNHRFHLEEILGIYIPVTLPENITVPLLIFPC
ncbi:universal stress protein [Mucilaginibacter xinganensis]|nr:hypothetical protein [Mucilaginibacter xinganensis]